MTVYAVIRKEDLEAGCLWNWEMQPSATLRVIRSLRKMRGELDVIGILCLFKKRVVSFLENLWGLLKSDGKWGERGEEEVEKEENEAKRRKGEEGERSARQAVNEEG